MRIDCQLMKTFCIESGAYNEADNGVTAYHSFLHAMQIHPLYILQVCQH